MPSRPQTVLAEGASPTRKTDGHSDAVGTALPLLSGAPNLTDHGRVKIDDDTDGPKQVDKQLARRSSDALNLTEPGEVNIEKDTDDERLLHRLSVLPSLTEPEDANIDEDADAIKNDDEQPLSILPDLTDTEEMNNVQDLGNAIKEPDSVRASVEQSSVDATLDVGLWLDLLQAIDENRPESPKSYLDFNEHYTGSRWSDDSSSPPPTTPQPETTDVDHVDNSAPQLEPEPEYLIDSQPGIIDEFITKPPTMSDFDAKTTPRSISFNDSAPCGPVSIPNIQPLNAAKESTRIIEDSQTRAHTPSPSSFSQPRISTRRSSPSGTPVVASASTAGSRLASRIPVLDPMKTPNRVSVKPSKSVPLPSGNDMVSGHLPVVTAADPVHLNHDSPRREQSKVTLRSQASSNFRSPSSAAYNLVKKVSLNSIRSRIRRVTPLPLEGERLTRRGVPGKASMAASIGHRAGSSTRQLSGQLSSGGNFSGSTLIISDDAHEIIMGVPRTDRDTGRNFPPISGPTNFQHVNGLTEPPSMPAIGQTDPSNVDIELGLEVTMADQESPIPQKTLRVNLPKIMADNQSGRFPGVNIAVEDQDSERSYAATLTLLERGEPPSMPTQDEIAAFAESYGTQPRQCVPSEQEYANDREHNEESIIDMGIENNTPASEEMVEQTHQTSRRPSDRVPRYMAQTASQRRRASRPLPRDDKSITSPSRASAKLSPSLGTTNKENSPKLGIGKRTPSRTTGTRTGSPGHTPLVQHAMNSNNFPRAPPSSPQAETILSMPGNGPVIRYAPMFSSQRAGEANMTHDGDTFHEPFSSGGPAAEPSMSGNGRATHRQPENKNKVGLNCISTQIIEANSPSQHRPRSESKSRFVSSVKGFFNTKREIAPPVPTINATHRNQSARRTHVSSRGNPEHGRSSIRVTEPAHSGTADKVLQSGHDNPTIRVTEPTQTADEALLDEPFTSDPLVKAAIARFSDATVSEDGPVDNNDTALERLVRELTDQGYEEHDRPRREQIFSLAQIFLDVLTNSKKAALDSHRAQVNAGAARGHHDMVQYSIAELGRRLAVPANSNHRSPLSDLLSMMGVRTTR